MREPARPIGGYFELETFDGTEYWQDALRINTARNCLRHLIRTFHIRKLYAPRYTCPVVWDAVRSERCEMEYYSVDRDLMPVSEFPREAYILYTNYLGVCTENASRLAQKYPRLITDGSQSFFSIPIGFASFNSARKFFGVPDGAYLFASGAALEGLDEDTSAGRVSHLLTRIELGPQPGYPAFLQNENRLCGEPVKVMSKLTQTLLRGIAYNRCAEIRRSNYMALQAALGGINEWRGAIGGTDVPMAYPFLCRKEGLREKLIAENIFVPTFWNGQMDPDTGKYMERCLLPLPIDQRYGSYEMRRISECILRNL